MVPMRGSSECTPSEHRTDAGRVDRPGRRARTSYFVGRWACNSLATMNANNLLTVVALAASLLLVLKVPSRLFPVIALVASAIEVLRAFGILSLKVPVIGAALLFGGAMVVGGVGSWIKSSGKVPVTAA